MQRISVSAVALAILSLALASCCNPCKERAAARKAAAEARYGAGSSGALPDVPMPAPAPVAPPASTPAPPATY